MTLKELLNAKEGENVEFKTATNRFDYTELQKYAAALSNRGGGVIVFGVSDSRPRHIVGTRAFEQPERTRRGLIDSLHVNVDFILYNENTPERVLAFVVASRPIGLPVQVNGVAWWRDGDSLVPMSSEIRRKIYDESGHDFSADICQGVTLDDLDEKAIEEFRRVWAEKSQNSRLKNMSAEQLLLDCDAISAEGVTYAALVLFGRKSALTKFLAQSEIVIEYRASNASGPAQYREEFRDAFFNIYNRLWEVISLRNTKQHYRDGLFVFDIFTFNEGAVRELIMNAVAHRNYQMCGSVFVIQYDDRLVVKSPGGFLPGITSENIINKQAPRNRRIAEILAKCGLVERSGQGMNLVFESSIKEAKELPSFSGTDENEVCVTLHGVVLSKGMLILINKIGAETLNSFSTQDFLVLNLLARHEQIPAELHLNARHLEDIGLSERVARSKYVLSRRYYNFIGRTGEYTRRVGLDRETNMALLLKHIRHNDKQGAKAAEFQQVLPSLSRGQIKTLLSNLRKEGKIDCRGAKRGAVWHSTEYLAHQETGNLKSAN